ncbi:MAG TPA: phosphoribosylanthranilate isomerase [Isosphaeraceae bacterium]|nr:phosphoribosylanthranilate isomerase [Isosphaeraceae bacterium]
MLVKVCGVTTPADAAAAASAGADWIGLNFHPGSPRRVDEPTAARILAALPAGVEPVGLFVDRPAAEVAAVAGRLGLRVVQLHGSEPVADLVALAHLQVVRAFRLGNLDDVARMSSYLARAAELGHRPHAVLVDAFVAGVAGGTGVSIAAPLLDAIPAHPRLILAGGLTPANVADRVALVRPWMVDVASGVEPAGSPGRKDPDLVAAFIRAARASSR